MGNALVARLFYGLKNGTCQCSSKARLKNSSKRVRNRRHSEHPDGLRRVRARKALCWRPAVSRAIRNTAKPSCPIRRLYSMAPVSIRGMVSRSLTRWVRG